MEARLWRSSIRWKFPLSVYIHILAFFLWRLDPLKIFSNLYGKLLDGWFVAMAEGRLLV